MSNLIWFSKYNIINNNIELKANIQHHIDKLNNDNIKNHTEQKIIDLEDNYNIKMNEYKDMANNIDSFIKSITNEQSLIILQKELEIIKILTRYTLQNKIINLDFYIPCLNLLLELSDTLRIRLNQKEIIYNKNNNNNLTRCSYKFCTYQENCNFNYNFTSKKICYQDHYVHNMVSLDIKLLLDYINNINTDGITIPHNKEILKTINTLSYVISHMETELRTKCLYLPENEWEKYHYIKNK